MPEDELTPACLDDTLAALRYALQFDSRGRAYGVTLVRIASPDQLAARVLDHLVRSRFVLMRLPPLVSHGGQGDPGRITPVDMK